MRHTSIPKLFLLLFFPIFSAQQSAYGQSTNDSTDFKRFNLGFSIGIHVSGFRMEATPNQTDPNTGWHLIRTETKARPGLHIGLIATLGLNSFMDLRFQPSVSLEERGFVFHYDSSTTDGLLEFHTRMESSNLNVPISLRLKSQQHGRYRFWIQLGSQFTLNLAATKKVANDPFLLKSDRFDYGIVGGAGVEIQFKYMTISPEIAAGHGLRNVFVEDGSVFPNAIQSLHARYLIFRLNFE